MSRFPIRQSIVGLAFVFTLTKRGETQLTGPRFADIDPQSTTQPICDGSKNDGLDFVVPTGTAVNAPADGVVTARWNDKVYGCGLTLMITSKDGSVVGLSWLSATSVVVGEKVIQGEQVGLSGQTGNASSPALHMTVWDPGKGKVDPRSIPIHRTDPDVMSNPLIDPAVLDDALKRLEASDLAPDVKLLARRKLIQKYETDRATADAVYKGYLDQAVNAWYANKKNWRKIPATVWSKIS